MTTWINSQFPRPDFHRRVQRHYGLQDTGFPLKQSLTTDDIAGIQSVWGASQPDQFNSNGQNNDSSNTPANTTSYISSNGQIAIPNLRITTASRAEWFSVTVPASTTGTMVVTDQSANLSMLSPSLWLDFNSTNTSPCRNMTYVVFPDRRKSLATKNLRRLVPRIGRNSLLGNRLR